MACGSEFPKVHGAAGAHSTGVCYPTPCADRYPLQICMVLPCGQRLRSIRDRAQWIGGQVTGN